MARNRSSASARLRRLTPADLAGRLRGRPQREDHARRSPRLRAGHQTSTAAMRIDTIRSVRAPWRAMSISAASGCAVLAGAVSDGTVNGRERPPQPADVDAVEDWVSSLAAPDELSFVTPRDAFAHVPERPTGADPLVFANWWRSFGGRYPTGERATPLVNDATRALTAQNHVDYLAWVVSQGGGYCGHSTDPTHPPPVANDRSHNVLFCGIFKTSDAVDGWARTPLHGQSFFDPAVVGVGFGSNSGFVAGGFTYGPVQPPPNEVHVFPGPNGIMPITTWLGGETPNPAELCPPTGPLPNGQPAFLLPVTGGRRGSDPWPVQHLNPRRAELVGTER